jgi:hypothetical protein
MTNSIVALIRFSHAFGFGLMDAGGMTRLAKNWVTVPTQKKCETPETPEKLLESEVVVPADEERAIAIDASSCNSIKHLEHLHMAVRLSAIGRMFSSSSSPWLS